MPCLAVFSPGLAAPLAHAHSAPAASRACPSLSESRQQRLTYSGELLLRLTRVLVPETAPANRPPVALETRKGPPGLSVSAEIPFSHSNTQQVTHARPARGQGLCWTGSTRPRRPSQPTPQSPPPPSCRSPPLTLGFRVTEAKPADAPVAPAPVINVPRRPARQVTLGAARRRGHPWRSPSGHPWRSPAPRSPLAQPVAADPAQAGPCLGLPLGLC